MDIFRPLRLAAAVGIRQQGLAAVVQAPVAPVMAQGVAVSLVGVEILIIQGRRF